MIIYYDCLVTNNLAHTKASITKLLKYTMGKDFHIRTLSQIIIRKLMEKFKITENYDCYNALVYATTHTENASNLEQIKLDFRFDISASNLLHPIYLLFEIPRLTGMSSDEIIPLRLFPHSVSELSKMEIQRPTPRLHNTYNSVIHSDVMHLNVDNVQKKMVLLKEIIPELDVKHDKKKFGAGLVVVASLISRAANLGGLSRTCEIFGAEKLILDSIKQIENLEFQALR